MSNEQALHQSLASCGAVLIAFIGVCHEFVGAILFPWGPALFGGPVGWYGVGVFTIVLGLLLLSGVLGLIKFPVVSLALAAAVIGMVVAAISAVAHHQFHMFACAVVAAGAVTAFFQHKAVAGQAA